MALTWVILDAANSASSAGANTVSLSTKQVRTTLSSGAYTRFSELETTWYQTGSTVHSSRGQGITWGDTFRSSSSGQLNTRTAYETGAFAQGRTTRSGGTMLPFFPLSASFEFISTTSASGSTDYISPATTFDSFTRQASSATYVSDWLSYTGGTEGTTLFSSITTRSITGSSFWGDGTTTRSSSDVITGSTLSSQSGTVGMGTVAYPTGTTTNTTTSTGTGTLSSTLSTTYSSGTALATTTFTRASSSTFTRTVSRRTLTSETVVTRTDFRVPVAQVWMAEAGEVGYLNAAASNGTVALQGPFTQTTLSGRSIASTLQSASSATLTSVFTSLASFTLNTTSLSGTSTVTTTVVRAFNTSTFSARSTTLLPFARQTTGTTTLSLQSIETSSSTFAGEYANFDTFVSSTTFSAAIGSTALIQDTDSATSFAGVSFQGSSVFTLVASAFREGLPPMTSSTISGGNSTSSFSNTEVRLQTSLRTLFTRGLPGAALDTSISFGSVRAVTATTGGLVTATKLVTTSTHTGTLGLTSFTGGAAGNSSENYSLAALLHGPLRLTTIKGTSSGSTSAVYTYQPVTTSGVAIVAESQRIISGAASSTASANSPYTALEAIVTSSISSE